jgi:hypothetical protein
MVFFPVFDHFDNGRQLVGFLSAAIYWRRLFTSALPTDGSGPIHVVLENDCGQMFTYVFNPQGEQEGQVVIIGHHHDDRYEYLELKISLSSIDEHSSEEEKPSSHDATTKMESPPLQGDILTYSGVGFDLGYCPYTVRIYPTAEMEHSFYTWQPLMYAMLVVFVLVFTSVIFGVYDSIVERRHRKVAQTAVESTAVIHSLVVATATTRTRYISPGPGR